MTLYGRIEITDLNRNTYTLGSENRGYSVTLHKDKADVFKLEVADPGDTFKDRYVEGGEVTVYCDSSNPPTTKVFNGVIETVTRKNVFGTRVLTIEATEKFWVQAMGALVSESFSDKKAGWIARTLVSGYLSGYTTTNMQDTDATIKSRTFKKRPLKECLDQLAEASGSVWYCTPGGDVYFHVKETVESGLSLTEPMIRGTPSLRKDLVDLATVVEVHGGVSLDLDQSQQTQTGGPVSLHDRDVAVKFTPSKAFGRYLELYVDKVGSPGRALSGRIAEDDGGLPSGVVREFFAYSEEQIDLAAWHGLKIDFPMDPLRDYWIILNRGGDASNCYRWYHDGGSTGTHAEKTDGSWSLVSGSWLPSFRLYAGNPVLAKATDPVGYSLYGRREYIVERPDITDKAEAVTVAQSILAERSVVRQEFEQLRVAGEDLSSLPQPGHLANLTVPQLGFDDKVVVEDIEIVFPAGSDVVDEVLFTVGQDPEDLSKVLKTIEERLEEEKRKGLDLDTLDLIELFQERFTLSDAVSTKQQGDTLFPILTATLTPTDETRGRRQTTRTFTAGLSFAGFSEAS